jgi:hypothetical protein
VVLVEEAGELLESQLMAAVASPALQHLIQFGTMHTDIVL